MPIKRRRAMWCLIVLPTALVSLSSCGVDDGDASRPSTSRASATTAATAVSAVSSTTTVAASPTAGGPRTEKWIDLAVGDCLADPPPSDPSAVTVTIVDCAAAHAAEVYARAPVAVNAAIADVASRECAAGFTRYTGQSANTSPFTVTYLIDSSQDRTVDNPTPSTVICLLQAANGQPLTGSARG